MQSGRSYSFTMRASDRLLGNDRNLGCLQQFAKNWMPLLFNAYVAAPAGQRSHLSRAIGAYAVIVAPDLLDTFFKTVVKKLIQASVTCATYVCDLIQHLS